MEMKRDSGSAGNVGSELKTGICYRMDFITPRVENLTRCGKRKIFYVCTTEEKGLKVTNDAKTFFRRAFFFPAKDIFYYKAKVAGTDLLEDRLQVLEALSDGEPVFVAMTPDALLGKTASLAGMRRRELHIQLGGSVNPTRLRKELVAVGYERVQKIQGRGEFAIRGSILDVFGFTMKNPVRIELFDDEVDSIRSFDVETQRSIENLESCSIFVASDNIAGEEETTLWNMAADPDTLVVLDEPNALMAYMEDMKDVYGEDLAKHYLTREEMEATMSSVQRIGFSLPDGQQAWFENAPVIRTMSRVPEYSGKVFGMIRDIVKWHKKNYQVRIYTASASRAKRLQETMAEEGVSATRKNGTDTPGAVRIIQKSITDSYIDEERKIVFLSDTAIFRKEARRPKKRFRMDDAEAVTAFSDLKVGDIVVHEDHGIGRYKGIEYIEFQGTGRDYLCIEYKGGDLLRIPTTRLETIQKYLGNVEAIQLSSLNTTAWSRNKQRVKQQVELIAKELVELYARRLDKKGFAYAKDDEMQREMEELFPYVETDDQLQATAEIKADMESEKIMDRLLCGDVGFGKTEVAMRAAFKAVLSGKQVVVLVPTTILAQQHYNVFRERMKDFPVSVGLLSRFVTPKQQKEVIERVNQGTVDILVGTHAVLTKRLTYHDLGLLIIDEEQRFGVRHKEKIKQLRDQVDVLTLSATPIPRTMHMSLAGIRDLSLLKEAPYERQAIQTYVMEYDPAMIAEAIRREVNRGGQVYFLHNRVQTIYEFADEVRKTVPNLIVEVAHGQMSRQEIEDIFESFVNGEIDVLVSTTIVETGLDIPNVNTIIIDQADRFGLSTLYQLRGRVGRSTRRAFAFLTYPKGKKLNPTALERLRAIREFSTLGSGTKIALRDLEIRGAGSLLGNMQHGHVEAIGYELYCKILRAAILEAKGETVPEEHELKVELRIDQYIDPSYIATESDRLEMYKKFNLVRDEDEYTDVVDECQDRFGDLPEAVLNVIRIGWMKNLARSVGIDMIREVGDTIELVFLPGESRIDPSRLVPYLMEHAKELRFLQKTDTLLIYRYDPNRKLDGLFGLVEELSKMRREQNGETTEAVGSTDE